VRNAEFFITAILLLVLLWPNFSLLAEDYSSTNFILRDPVITIEGGRSTSAGFEYFSSSGQIAPGESTSAGFILRAGFLYFPASTSASSDSGGGGSVSGGYAVPISSEIIKQAISVCDFNKDGRCDIVDFSILLYYFDRSGLQIRPYDLNYDGQINLIDFSILLFYWNY